MPNFDPSALLGMIPWQTVVVSLAASVIGIMLLMPLANQTGWVDRPSVRKAHEGNIPLVGGWAILIGLLCGQLFGDADERAPVGFWVGALLLFFVSLVDDRYPIRARYRFAVQFVAAIAGLWMGGQALTSLGDLLGTGPLTAWWLLVPVSIVGAVAVINAVNFMDGADGLCGGMGVIALFWFLVSVALATSSAVGIDQAAASYAATIIPLASAMIGAVAGFLAFNLRTPVRRRAVVFLGDSGSMLVGFTLAWLSIHVTSSHGGASVSPVVSLWIMAVPLFDSASCFVRRIRAGTTPMTADLRHLHHLLQESGLSVAQSVCAIHAGAFVCGLVGVVGWWLRLPDSVLFAAFVFALLTFIAVTNYAWSRIDRVEPAERVAMQDMGG